jgi:hypothetical protein
MTSGQIATRAITKCYGLFLPRRISFDRQTLLQEQPPPSSSSQLPLPQYADRNPLACDGAPKRHQESFVASQGMLKLAAPVPSGQNPMTYIFKAMPDNTPYPKLTDTDGKPDCLLCFLALSLHHTIRVNSTPALQPNVANEELSASTST